jgi:hypothetical protein
MSPIESVAKNLSHSRTRALNQLHALLRELMAGGAPISLTAVSATSALRGFRPRTGPDRIRVELAKELIADVRRFDEQLAANAAKMTALLDEHGTVLREIDISDRSSLPVCWAAAARRAGSPRPPRTRTTPAPRRSKSQAPIPRGTRSPATETAN